MLKRLAGGGPLGHGAVATATRLVPLLGTLVAALLLCLVTIKPAMLIDLPRRSATHVESTLWGNQLMEQAVLIIWRASPHRCQIMNYKPVHSVLEPPECVDTANKFSATVSYAIMNFEHAWIQCGRGACPPLTHTSGTEGPLCCSSIFKQRFQRCHPRFQRGNLPSHSFRAQVTHTPKCFAVSRACDPSARRVPVLLKMKKAHPSGSE